MTPGDIFALRWLLVGSDADRFVLVTDKGVPRRHVADLRDQLTLVAPFTTRTMAGGEHAKTLTAIEGPATAAVRAGAAVLVRCIR